MLLRRTILPFLVLAFCQCYANEDFTSKDSGSVTITLQNAADKLSKIDSVFVIFDRYDLRGAGVIRKVFYPDTENQIHVSLPKGKYYINIYCLGIYNKESFDRIVSTRPRKNHRILLRLQESALYQQGLARIPADHFDPSHLAILNFVSK
jgi:predicted transcriptional regulator